MPCFCCNPCSPDYGAPTPSGMQTPVNTGPSVYCTVMADTAGVLYRAFSARPTWLGGTGKPSVDRWTRNILICCEKQSLIQAGGNPADAEAQASNDVIKSLQSNCACPCKQPSAPLSMTALILIVVAGAIVLIVFSNVFAHKLVD